MVAKERRIKVGKIGSEVRIYATTHGRERETENRRVGRYENALKSIKGVASEPEKGFHAIAAEGALRPGERDFIRRAFKEGRKLKQKGIGSDPFVTAIDRKCVEEKLNLVFIDHDTKPGFFDKGPLMIDKKRKLWLDVNRYREVIFANNLVQAVKLHEKYNGGKPVRIAVLVNEGHVDGLAKLLENPHLKEITSDIKKNVGTRVGPFRWRGIAILKPGNISWRENK